MFMSPIPVDVQSESVHSTDNGRHPGSCAVRGAMRAEWRRVLVPLNAAAVADYELPIANLVRFS